MTVDFAYKQRSRGNDGFALRNIKLRMSRKLIYIAGLLACFKCHLSYSQEDRGRLYRRENLLEVLTAMRGSFEQPPLDIIASTLLEYEDLWPQAISFFSSYDDFLALLSDKSQRTRLSELKPHEIENDPTYRDARAITHRFREAVRAIFLTPTNPIGDLTIRFGVF